MKNKQFLLTLLITAFLTLGVTAGVLYSATKLPSTPNAQSIAVKSVSQDITASGSIHSENEATLHFATAGKVVYLPFKEGDTVTLGQTIAQLDTYALQRQLQQALLSYQSTRDSFDQTQQNAQNNIAQSQQSANVPGVQGDKTGAVNDIVKRLLDQNQNTLNSSVLNVELANYAVQLAALTTPISGVITHEDITTPNVNVTTATAFSVADPTTKVFRANVLASDIDFVSVGGGATVRLDGSNQTISGTIEKIYPQKTTLATGEDVYMVDIQASGLSGLFGQTGSVTIKSNNQSQALMVPTWAILGHNSVWVWENGKAILKPVSIGTNHNGMTEVTEGLSPEDKVITDPATVAKGAYSVL